MAERERSRPRPRGGVFVPRVQVLTRRGRAAGADRIAHEIVERNRGLEDVVLVGLQTGGVPLAFRLAERRSRRWRARPCPSASLDVAFYRDDIGIRPVLPEAATDIPGDLAGQLVVLVDDVLFTGRTVRAALNALGDYGRARAVQLAVMVDRGHRELPDPPRLRRQEPARPASTSRSTSASTASSSATWCRHDRAPSAPPIADAGSEPETGSGRAVHEGWPPVGPHLLSIADLGAEGIEEVLRVSDAFVEVERRAIPKVPALRGRTVVTLFAEESTRTRLSFETAAKRLSADVLSLPVASSSVKKGESLRDTVETVAAMGVDAFVVRHPSLGRARAGGALGRTPAVINAGDGWHEHPTQALLDCYTIRQVLAERSGVDPRSLGSACFAGLRVAIVGDVRHSRVARSQVLAYVALGAEVTLVAPGSLLPPVARGLARGRGRSSRRPRSDRARRRLPAPAAGRAGRGVFLPSLREYTRLLRPHAGERAALLGRAGASSCIPGPMNRGWRSPTTWRPAHVGGARQVANGVAVRMAVLFLLLGRRSGAGRSASIGQDGTVA